ncbi:hypothetical protein [uncultured Tateyamaria sp.]|uniref:hypothetical protein n=1 Tax=uncultured Tateyamaria sp. TaxID=455651 RepID=UPI00262C0DAD|nr:hypothetical protein [uncultured Tateyamaria sp.]
MTADTAATLARTATQAARHAALAASNRPDSPSEAERAISRFVHDMSGPDGLSTQSEASSAVTYALSKDCTTTSSTQLLTTPIWPDGDIPSPIIEAHKYFVLRLEYFPDWAFFKNWYLAVYDGRSVDWALTIEVAKLPNEVWNAGLAEVAQAIREIEARHSQGTGSVESQEVTSSNVTNLLARAPIVQASMASMSEAVSLRLDSFSSMGRPNEEIPFVRTLRSMPETALRIIKILENSPSYEGSDAALALEVGSLRAEVEQLKADLKMAHAELTELRKKPWYKSTSVLFAGSVTSAIAVSLWTISDEDFNGENRWNNLAQELDFLAGKVWPDANDRIPEGLRFKLPDIEET